MSDGPTHPGIANTEYVKRKIQEQASQLIELQHASRHLTNVRTTIGIVAVAVGTFFSAFFVLEARGQARSDAGDAPIIADVRKVEARVDKVESKIEETAMRTVRIEVMTEQLLKVERIKPPPPVVMDGGR